MYRVAIIYNSKTLETTQTSTSRDRFVPGQWLSCVWLFVTPWTIARILQVRILEWVAISYNRGSSCPRNRTCISCGSCSGRRILYCWATWEAQGQVKSIQCKAMWLQEEREATTDLLYMVTGRTYRMHSWEEQDPKSCLIWEIQKQTFTISYIYIHERNIRETNEMGAYHRGSGSGEEGRGQKGVGGLALCSFIILLDIVSCLNLLSIQNLGKGCPT